MLVVSRGCSNVIHCSSRGGALVGGATDIQRVVGLCVCVSVCILYLSETATN